MFPAASWFIAFLAIPSIMATPMEVRTPHRVNLPVAKRINASGGPIKLVQHDQARAAALLERGTRAESGYWPRDSAGGSSNVPATNFQGVTYVAAVGVGNPATTYNLIIDTGSSNTWLGADKPYKRTSTSKCSPDPVLIPYGSGAFVGFDCTDTVTLGAGLTIAKQSIGVARFAEGFEGLDGILGLGPEDLTQETEPTNFNKGIPTVIQNLYAQREIEEEVLGVFFAPTDTWSSDTNGELTFGGADPTRYTGTVNYIPVTTTAPSSNYWGVNQTIMYGSTGTSILTNSAGIVDTGTTLILLATEAFKTYQAATGGTDDPNTGLLEFTASQYGALQSLIFKIGTVEYSLIPNAQIWPRVLNTYIGGKSGSIYSIVNDLGTLSKGGLSFIDGQSFLQRFYSVFDTTNSRVGFATTSFTNATTN